MKIVLSMRHVGAKHIAWISIGGLIIIACLLCRYYYLENIKEISVQAEASFISVLKESMDKKVRESKEPYWCATIAPDTVPLTVSITSKDGMRSFKIDPLKSKKNISQNRHERLIQSVTFEKNPFKLDSINLIWAEKLDSNRISAYTTISMTTMKLDELDGNVNRLMSHYEFDKTLLNMTFNAYIGLRCEVEVVAQLSPRWWSIILYRWLPFVLIIIGTIFSIIGISYRNKVNHKYQIITLEAEKNALLDESEALATEIVKAKVGEYELKPGLIFSPKQQVLIYQGEVIKLPPQSCVILKLFLDAEEHTLADNAILKNIWGNCESATIDRFRVACSKLCKSLKEVEYSIKFVRIGGDKYCMLLLDS